MNTQIYSEAKHMNGAEAEMGIKSYFTTKGNSITRLNVSTKLESKCQLRRFPFFSLANSTRIIADINKERKWSKHVMRLRVAAPAWPLPFPEAIKGLCRLNSLPVIWLCFCKRGGTFCLHKRRLQVAPLREQTSFIPDRVGRRKKKEHQ